MFPKQSEWHPYPVSEKLSNFLKIALHMFDKNRWKNFISLNMLLDDSVTQVLQADKTW